MASTESYMGYSCPAFLGGLTDNIRSITRNISSTIESAKAKLAKMAVTLYTPKEFAFDINAGMADVHVAEYAQLAAADRAAGTYDASMAKLLSFVNATLNALRERTSAAMTDAQTQEVVDILGRLNLILDITQQNFSAGVPADSATEVDTIVAQINEVTDTLMRRRQSMYAQAMKLAQEYAAQQPAPYIPAGQGPGQPPNADFPGDIPGGGAAGQAGQVISDEGPVVQQTTMQKYGPVAALAAGGILAYLALR